MRIYVLTHKRCNPPKGEIFVPLHVGRALSEDLGYLGDDTGENISDLNPLFGELTGIYWIWQNDKDSDYIGVCHYRRFYLDESDKLLCEEDFYNRLNKYDCLTSDLLESNVSNYEGFSRTHTDKDLLIVKDSLLKLYPEYEASFDAYMADNKSCYSNLLVMPRQMFSDYCQWLFSILFDASERIDVTGYDLYRRRVYGFLSEFLLDVYVRHNGFNVLRNPVGTFGDKAETTELINAVSVLIKKGQMKEARKLVDDILRLRPDIMLPMSDSENRIPVIEHLTCILDMEKDMGVPGMISVSDDVNELIGYYRRVHKALSDKAEDEISYLKDTALSPIAAVVMTVNDIAKSIQMQAIGDCRDYLKKLFSEADYNAYSKYRKQFDS